ncbi:hypothetical protein PIB30_008215 [Stylosanthes scabra]|uniref:Uncharacterized protein n=1 Tax=Stylosanthes scabra TaxID=79078 RepID=A0ABU6Q5Z0_9FABA|nr:hypothetical protein [Stylosanthes scabra]
MGKKKSCQDVKVPRPLNEVENRFYDWVEEAVFTQPSVVQSESLPEFRRNFPLMGDSGMEGDYVLEAAGPSDRVPFRTNEGSPHFLWVYQEFFTCLGAWLPFSDFQRDVMTRCRVAASQLHLNGWGFILTFEKEESIQEFKWHYFKVLAAPGKWAFWLDDEGNPFPWVYWNPEVKDFIVFNLDPLEMAACDFLLSLPISLPKKRNNFSCRWILDHSDTEVGKFLDDLLSVKMKRTKLDKLMAQMADLSKMGPRAILPTDVAPAASSSQVPPIPTASSKKKRKDGDDFDRALGDDASWEHEVSPMELAYPEGFNIRKALNAGLTTAPTRELLTKMPLEQLLGESYRYSAKSLACLQVGLETSVAAKVKAEKELLSTLDQIEVLKAERDSVLSFREEKTSSLTEQLSQKDGELQSSLDPVAQIEEDNWRKRAESTKVESRDLKASLETARSKLAKAKEEADYWCSEWKRLATEPQEMCQETLEVVLDQVSHLCPDMDFSAITLKSYWDPKGRRIYVPEDSPEADPEVVTPEVIQPDATQRISEQEAEAGAGEGGGCPT